MKMDGDSKRRLKNKNPAASTSWLSQIFLGWTLPIFTRGFKTNLTEEDLTLPLDSHKSSFMGDQLEKAWLSETKKSKPSLKKAVNKVFGRSCWLLGISFMVVYLVLRTMEPLLLHQLLHYFADYSHLSLMQAKIYAWALVVSTALVIIIIQPSMIGTLHLGLKVRVALRSLIYRKALRLSRESLRRTTPGQIVNLLSNDPTRFDHFFTVIHLIWISPLQAIVSVVILWEYVGVSGVVGMVAFLLVMPFHGYLGKLVSRVFKKTSARTDERVRLMNEIITGIHVIKVHTWEKAFEKIVSYTRKKEIQQLRKTSFIFAIMYSFMIFHFRTSLFITVLAYVLLGNHVTAAKVFLLSSIYNILRTSLLFHLPFAISRVAEGKVALERIHRFFMNDETSNDPVFDNVKGIQSGYWRTNESTLKPLVRLNKVSARWLSDSNENSLSNINYEFDSNRLSIIVGPIGSGKTSLIQALLNEMTIVEGSVTVTGTLSYASQDPWLFQNSIRQNILFGSEYDADRYRNVIRICSLHQDMKQLPFGDKTIIGERGMSLSGGQKARVNLARAIYKEADIYLLDDPLSALDPHVSKLIFEECIQKYLRTKTVILITHQLQCLMAAHHIVLMDQGLIKATGTYDEIKTKVTDFIDFLPADFTNEGTAIERREVRFEDPVATVLPLNQSELHKSFQSFSSFSIDHLSDVIAPKEVAERRVEGSISWSTYKSYFLGSSRGVFFILVAVLFVLAQAVANASDYWLARWMNLEEMDLQKANGTDLLKRREECIDVYIWLTVATIVITLIRSVCYFLLCLESSQRLHDSMFDSVVRATMWFFNNNNSGRILNRFSKDLGSIDQVLPSTSIDVFQMGLTLLGVFVICIWMNPWMLIPTIVCIFVFYYFRNVYIATSRSLKRLEATSLSPIIQHLNATLQGLVTIRAFNSQKVLTSEFDEHQDLNTSASYLLLSCGRAFALWLDTVCLAYITIVIMGFFYFPNDHSTGDFGLSLTQSLGLVAVFQWVMRQAAEMENHMTSVERVLEYSGLESEPSLISNGHTAPKSWPETGKITFKDLTLTYDSGEPPVLKKVNFTIEPRQKIGVVGRTGAGKSSLLQALFRLIPFDGQIIIDGLDQTLVDLKHWRSKISIIPQDPVLFSGSVRKNLDPFEVFSDDTLWKTLEEVELKDVIVDMKHGLQSQISEGGENLSIGQRQLLCLARAIVRNNNILVLDEATANVDLHTDALIQKTIRRLFQNCTVLTIAHRINTILDSDKIIVMDKGSIVEFDHPYNLLRKPEGIFREMLENSGESMENALRRLTQEISD